MFARRWPQANVDQAKGVIDGARQSYTIGANDQLFTSEQYKPIVVAYHNGAPVRLSDVANVIDGTENTRLAAWMNQTPAVIVNIQRQPGANIISVVDRIKKLLPQLAGFAAVRGEGADSHRPDYDHPRLGEGRGV